MHGLLGLLQQGVKVQSVVLALDRARTGFICRAETQPADPDQSLVVVRVFASEVWGLIIFLCLYIFPIWNSLKLATLERSD